MCLIQTTNIDCTNMFATITSAAVGHSILVCRVANSNKCFLLTKIRHLKLSNGASFWSKRQFCEMPATHVDLSHAAVVSKEQLHKFMCSCMSTVDCDPDHASQLAHVLIAGDNRGHYSHGVNRLGMYVNDIRKGVCRGRGQPKVLKDAPATAWVDGENLLGPVVGNFCMDLAIEKAKTAGIGWVVCKGSNHYGIAGWYSMRAMEQGLIGIAMTNTSPIEYPTRSARAALGTNPLSVAAPSTSRDNDFVLDMATTAVAVGKVEIADRTGQREIPQNWAVDGQGHETRDPKVMLKEGGLYPLGGDEVSSGYKGYGLSAMVELFCGILGGATWGPNVRKWMNTDREADLGQCFAAINPSMFAPGFSDRLTDMVDTMRSLPTTDASKPVLVAGDPERVHMQTCEQLGGIPYHPNQMDYMINLAKELGVSAPELVKKL